MPGMSGLDLLQQIMAFDPSIDVVLMTAYYTSETAVEAIQLGASDYLEKPLKMSVLRHRVSELVASAEGRLRAFSESSSDSPPFQFEGLITRSPAMGRLLAMVQRVAPHFRSVLIQGPTGAGKDLVARALHQASGVQGKFVVLNCSAIVETLFESELFGHVRGAFTDADRDKSGFFELADRGTLFLDEIGDMPLSTQAKLLRAVENQEVLPVGALSARKVNVRIIAATHRDLRSACADRTFRDDLFYRLSMVELTVPALKERKEDIAVLARHFVQRFASEYSKLIDGVTPRALIVLHAYHWPGNVRELEHVVGRACMMTENRMIDVADLPAHLLSETSIEDGGLSQKGSLLSQQEREMVERALRDSHGNQSETARRLGIGRDALRYKLKKYELIA